jgi:putative PEP-CTERM system TPR-repeat lipoprotein
MAVLAACPAAQAKESAASVTDAERYVAKGDLKAAEIELRNAIREAPQDPALRARLAEIYLKEGDAELAEREAHAARDRNGAEADYLPVLADALLFQAKFGDVSDLIKVGAREPALESKLRTALGTAAVGLNDRDKAQAMFRDAIRLDPGAARPKIKLARLVAETKPEEADRLIDEAIAADPRSVENLQTKADILRARGDLDGAVRLFDEALKIDPKNLLAHLSRADVAIAQGRFQAADVDLDPILKAYPENFGANYLRGVELVKQQKYDAADRIFDRISPGFVRFWSGYHLQGAMKLALGQPAQAETILRKYLAHAPDDPRASRLIATAALRQGAPSRAIDYLKPVAEKSTAEAETLSLLGSAYMANGKPELALQQFEKAAALDPENPAIKTRVAVSEIGAGRSEQGLEQLEQVFASQTGATIAGPTLVLTELRAGRADKAAEIAASLVKRDTNNPLYQTLLGEVRAVQRDYSGAEMAFRAALARSPEFAAASRDLAQVYRSTGRIADAEKMYNDLLARNADDAHTLLGLADIYVAEEKWSNAIAAINRARSAVRNDPAPGLKLVRLYEARLDWNSAKAVAGELVEQFPRDVNVLRAQARAQLEAGDTAGAISAYKRAYQLAPDSPAILSRYVALLNQAKYFHDAFAVLQQAVARDPGNASLKADLIRVDEEIDGVDGAILRAEEFAKKDPDSSLYPLVSAEIYEKAGRTADATALLEKALAKRASDDDLTIALSRLYSRAGDFGKAETLLTGRLQTDPKNIAAGSALGPLFLMTGRPDAARRAYMAVLAQRQNDVAALIGLADIAGAEMKWEEAKGYIARARSAAPDDPAPGLRLVKLDMSRQDWRNAVTAASEVATKFPTDLDVLDAKGRAQIAAGDTPGAIATYRHIYQLSPDSAAVMGRYLAVLDQAKNFSEAQTVLRAALDRDPKNPSLRANLIRVAAQIDGLDAGLAAARDFAGNDPDNSLYDVVAADLYEKAGRGDDAAALLEKSAAARPADDRLTAALSRLYVRLGQSAKAEAFLKGRVKADPKDTGARAELALYYLGQRKDAAAIAEYSRLVDERPGDQSVLNNLAWLYQQHGDLRQAREMAERAFSIAPRSPQIDDTLGWILLAQGEPGKALTYLGTAYSEAPRDPGIQYHLAVALHHVGRPADARAMLETLLGSGVSFADKPDAEKLLKDLQHS